MLQSWAGTLHYDDSVMSRRSSLWLFNNEQVHFITLMQSWAYAVHYYANMSRRTSLWWCKHEQAHFIMMMQSWADAIIMMLQSWPSALHYDGAIMTKRTSLWWCNHDKAHFIMMVQSWPLTNSISLWWCNHEQTYFIMMLQSWSLNSTTIFSQQCVRFSNKSIHGPGINHLYSALWSILRIRALSDPNNFAWSDQWFV